MKGILFGEGQGLGLPQENLLFLASEERSTSIVVSGKTMQLCKFSSKRIKSTMILIASNSCN
jgi:hypothetical protein